MEYAAEWPKEASTPTADECQECHTRLALETKGKNRGAEKRNPLTLSTDQTETWKFKRLNTSNTNHYEPIGGDYMIIYSLAGNKDEPNWRKAEGGAVASFTHYAYVLNFSVILLVRLTSF